MNQITQQHATPRARQSEALSDCIIEELRRYDEPIFLCYPVGMRSETDGGRVGGECFFGLAAMIFSMM